jgi:hypothetical protein
MGCCGNCEDKIPNYNERTDGSLYPVTPFNYGWLEYKLHPDTMEYLWNCIENKKESNKNNLVGQLNSSYCLEDTDGYFNNTVIMPLIDKYHQFFGTYIPNRSGFYGNASYVMKDWWVNYQKEGDFNPIHNHGGIYSFVIWMKIPTEHEEQNSGHRSKDSNTQVISDFHMVYVNSLGDIDKHQYKMNPYMEGYMLFFPSKMHHIVYPFFNCDEDRISISGNIYLI